jgi:hypothetical protein
MRSVIRSLDNTNELVPDRTLKPGISANDLDVGVADPRPDDTHKGFTVLFGRWNVGEQKPSV